MKDRWWLSSKTMTVLVTVENGMVVRGPPIVRKFVRQPVANLRRWMIRQGGFQARKLKP